jgi:hypothetical protein
MGSRIKLLRGNIALIKSITVEYLKSTNSVYTKKATQNSVLFSKASIVQLNGNILLLTKGFRDCPDFILGTTPRSYEINAK